MSIWGCFSCYLMFSFRLSSYIYMKHTYICFCCIRLPYNSSDGPYYSYLPLPIFSLSFPFPSHTPCMILLSWHLTLAIHNFLSYFLFLGKYIPPLPAGLYVQSKPCGHMDCALVIIYLTANVHIYCLILCVLIYSPRNGPTLTVS